LEEKGSVFGGVIWENRDIPKLKSSGPVRKLHSLDLGNRVSFATVRQFVTR
jgi:hypothetical protein